MTNKQIQTWVFAGLLILLFFAVCQIFAPFFTVLLWSILIYVLFNPLHSRAVARLDGRKHFSIVWRNLIAAAFSVLAVVIIVVPLSLVGLQLGKQITILVRFIIDYINENPTLGFDRFPEFTAALKDMSGGVIDLAALDIKREIIAFLSKGANTAVHYSTMLIRNIGSFLISLAFMVFTLFFFFMDGPYLLKLVVRSLPIRTDYISKLVQKFRDITRNLFLGYILVAFVQGIIAYLLFIVFKVPGALVFAMLLMFCSFIPMFGAATIWLPLGVARIISGDIGGGLLFLALSGIFISLTDNFLRPFFLRDRIQLHPLIIFFAILGGIQVFGLNGLILGPMVVIFFLTVLDLFLLEHKIEDGS